MIDINDHIIVLARHGQSNFNIEQRIQDPKNPFLTKLGHQQSNLTGKKIKKLGINFDLIICSDATRNVESLREIYPNYKEMANVKIDSRLRERYHGDLIGKAKVDIEKQIGQKFSDRMSWELFFEGTNKSQLTAQNFRNNESLESIKKRVMSLISEIKSKKNILLIGSAIFNHYILEFLEYKTIGVNKPQFPKDKEVEFQKNNELKIITADKNMKMKNYSSIKY
jgi:broad specificity phosphatase PhoE